MQLSSAALSKSAYIQAKDVGTFECQMSVTCNWCSTCVAIALEFELPDIDWVASMVKHLREDCTEVPKDIDAYEMDAS
jgi:hypothetical protein